MAAESSNPIEPDGVSTDHQGIRGALNPVVQLGRLLPAALQDLRSISESMRLLEDLLSELAAIRVQTEDLNDEVTRMRKRVDRLDDQMSELRGSVDAELREVGLAVHPLRRVGRSLGMRSNRRRDDAR